MTRIALVDYGAGNLVSIAHALEHVGAQVAIAKRPVALANADGIVVPGVGASGPAMRRLRRTGLADALERAVADGAVLLGVCLGMQLLFEGSDEDGADGLGWFGGRVRLLPDAPRLPHIGWNTVEPIAAHPLLGGRGPRPFYFVHSYAPDPTDPDATIAETVHGGRFASAVARGRIMGVQFHPEKSAADGLELLAAFVAMAADPAELDRAVRHGVGASSTGTL